MVAKQRINYIDTARFIGLILVLFNHIPNGDGYLNLIASAFRMPMFFILAGVFLSNDVRKAVIKGFKGIIIPYIIFNVAYIICNLIINVFYGFSFEDDVLYPFIGIFTGRINIGALALNIPAGATWFFIALYFGRIIISYILNQKFKWQILSIIVIFCIYYLIHNYITYKIVAIEQITLGAIFIWVGVQIKSFILNIQSIKPIYLLVLLALLPLLYINGTVLMWRGDVGNNIILFFINGITGTTALILLCAKINKINSLIHTIVAGAPFFVAFHILIMEYVMLIYRRITAYGDVDPLRILDKIIITILTVVIIYAILKIFGKRIPFLLK